MLSTLIQLLTLLQQLEDRCNVVGEEVLGHQTVDGRAEANQHRHHLLQPAAAVGGKLVPAAADELEVAEQVEEEAGLVGHQQVEQNIMLQVHRLQEDQEGGVRVDAGVQLRLLPGEGEGRGVKLTRQTLLWLTYRDGCKGHLSWFMELYLYENKTPIPAAEKAKEILTALHGVTRTAVPAGRSI